MLEIELNHNVKEKMRLFAAFWSQVFLFLSLLVQNGKNFELFHSNNLLVNNDF